ncbi:hypothetical protein I9W82_004119 [Candida metapsilosis]|uniref:Uncharacterized protein n=1 Tax=Candida metapsilosis TaxID=273372 RepID=A0A8H7ZGU4_9ASCO|nr:hypothetical protein I9W82_004119 [Candida metapsilosis]
MLPQTKASPDSFNSLQKLQRRQANFDREIALLLLEVPFPLWGQADTSFKIYFEYLSITESAWYDRKKMAYNSKLQNNKLYGQDSKGSLMTVEILKKLNQSVPKKHRFRLKKSANRTKRPKIRRYTTGFKISSTSLSCNYGIVTEDVFK